MNTTAQDQVLFTDFTSDYPELTLCINGQWLSSSGRPSQKIINPASEETLGDLPHATETDLQAALAAAEIGFGSWRRTSALERNRKLRRVAELIRERREQIAPLITLELGKPHRESLMEAETAADMFDWAAEEARRAYGRTIPARAQGVRLIVERIPVGPVAGFCGWNAPIITPSRKISSALAAGCSIIMKPAETTPATALALMRCVLDAEVPPETVSMIFGEPAMVSQHLLGSPVIKLVTFTGSTSVGKHLVTLAAQTMKRTVMELGGHAPVIVCDDVDPVAVAKKSVAAKFRNAGQVCTSPTRFFVQRGIYDEFSNAFTKAAASVQVGDGFAEGTQMGPLHNLSRLEAIADLVRDAVKHGARLTTGGERLAEKGFFFSPTVLCDVPEECRAMREEPFGPLALIIPFEDCKEAAERANSLSVGLAGYIFTNDVRRMALLREEVECGTLSFNHFVASWAETPFGGVKESGLGSEGGIEGMQAFQQVKFISEA